MEITGSQMLLISVGLAFAWLSGYFYGRGSKK
jgi:hypothetical protein